MKDRLSIDSMAFDRLGYQVSETQWLFKDLSLQLPFGEIIRLISKPGGGKSTFLRVLSGLCEPHEGIVNINSESVYDQSFDEFQRYRIEIGYGFDQGGLLNNMTLTENIQLPLLYHKILDEEAVRTESRNWLEFFELERAATLRPFSVSGGQRKAACLARAMVTKPQMLFLDDPTTGLSKVVADRFALILSQGLASGLYKYVVVASEDEAFWNFFDPIVMDLNSTSPLQSKSAEVLHEG